MSSFEWVSSVISFLSLISTIWFGSQVYKLSKQANNIAQDSLNFQMKINEKWEGLKDSYDMEEEKNEKLEKFSESEEIISQLDKTVKKIKTRAKYEEYKEWKQKNNTSIKKLQKTKNKR